MKRIALIIFLVVLIFYHLYPQAISFFGFSFIFTSGAMGLGLYIYNGRPYTEIMVIVGAYLIFGFFYLLTYYVTFYSDPYFFNNTKSQVAYVFSAYLITYIFFQIHPRGTFINLALYVIIAVAAQGVISLLMYTNPRVNSFFSSLQMVDALALYKREMSEGDRLLGYGTAFFGAGIIYGAALILNMYVLIRKKLNLLNLVLVSALYAFLFFVGILSARTTIVGFFASVVLLFFSFFIQNNPLKKQYVSFIALAVLFGIIGYTACYLYFPEFADWAFEAFINYNESGEFRTKSSDSLEHMMRFPNDFQTWVFGRGGMQFWGSDVGISRLIFYIGLPGTVAFFFYQFALAYLCFTKDKVANVMFLLFIAYALALNVKGLADVNSFLYIFVFYFLYYKYYVFTPQVYKLGKFNSTKLRYAVQGEAPGRRVQGNV